MIVGFIHLLFDVVFERGRKYNFEQMIKILGFDFADFLINFNSILVAQIVQYFDHESIKNRC